MLFTLSTGDHDDWGQKAPCGVAGLWPCAVTFWCRTSNAAAGLKLEHGLLDSWLRGFLLTPPPPALGHSNHCSRTCSIAHL